MEVYKKVGRKYVPMGHEFRGFPLDGFWVVLKGSYNCIYHIDENAQGQVPKLDHRRHIDKIMKDIDKNKSIYDIVYQVCEYFDALKEKQA